MKRLARFISMRKCPWTGQHERAHITRQYRDAMPTGAINEETAAVFGTKTKGKILLASLALFNADGFDRVTTSQIAKSADVLEGTLWYHFKAKQLLVHAHLEALEHILQVHFAQTLGDSGPEIAGYFLRYFQIMWDFRYLPRDQLESLLDDPAFTARLQSTYVLVEDKVQHRLEHAADQGLLDLSGVDVRTLTMSCMIIGRYWRDYARIRYADHPDPDRDRLQGIYQMVSLLRPYYTKKAHRLFEGVDIATLARARPS